MTEYSNAPFDSLFFPLLEELESKHLRRSLRLLETPQGPSVSLAGKNLLNFSSNDYLGLATAPELLASFQDAAATYGVGSGASRLISGTLPPHAELETTLASFKKTEAALAFSCGYATALGTIPAIVQQNDVVILDKLSHACLVDGSRLSGASLRVFPHNDTEKLESHLRWAREKFPSARILVITESVFSMDGDLSPLKEIADIKDRYGAWLMVDEAHGIGVVGKEGRGLVDALDLGERVEIQMGTLGKALGSAGGYIAGSRTLIDWLINRCRSFIFSTSPPPASAAASTAALRLLQSPQGIARVRSLHENLAALSRLCPSRIPAPPPSAILPILLGKEETALAATAKLAEEGFFVPAVRFPTVPKNSARLRLTVTASHSHQHLADLAAALNRVL